MRAAGRPTVGSHFVSALRWVDRWVCMIGAACCFSRSVNATRVTVTKTADLTGK